MKRDRIEEWGCKSRWNVWGWWKEKRSRKKPFKECVPSLFSSRKNLWIMWHGKEKISLAYTCISLQVSFFFPLPHPRACEEDINVMKTFSFLHPAITILFFLLSLCLSHYSRHEWHIIYQECSLLKSIQANPAPTSSSRTVQKSRKSYFFCTSY